MRQRHLSTTVLLVAILVLLFYGISQRWSPQLSSSRYPDRISGLSESATCACPPAAPEPSEIVPPQSSRSGSSVCPIRKLSMMYGTYDYPQMEIALDTHRRQCEQSGCRMDVLHQNLTVRDRYSKHYFLLSTMLQELSKSASERMTWLMWVDADSIVLNPSLSPCTFLPPKTLDNVFALVTADHQGLNNGVFFLKVHPSSVDLLTQIVAYPLEHHNEDLGWFGEQMAMANVIRSTEMRLQKQNRLPGIAWVPREWFNAYEFDHGFEGKPGHFMVHFAGLADARLSHMANWLDELQQKQVIWDVPLSRTFYKTAVPAYWKQFAANSSQSAESTDTASKKNS